MKKYACLLSILSGIILFACGGGGGGGGDSSNNNSQNVYTSDYMTFDPEKVYTFQETEVDTPGGQNTSNVAYSFDTNVSVIPPEYGYSGKISGPYLLSTVEKKVGSAVASTIVTYMKSDDTIISDDSTIFTNIDSSKHTGGSLPPDMVLGTEYSFSSTEDIFNSDSTNADFTFGEKMGTKKTEWFITALTIENVTVPAGTFQALKTEDTSTVTITNNDNEVFTVITSSGNTWFGKNVGTVKKVMNNTYNPTGGSTTTSTVTDELVSW
jgi:hypothetical protein